MAGAEFGVRVYDAPVLYAMYLDKPMRDHTLLQAIARVNRLYVNEAEEMVKPPNDRSAPDALPRAHDASRQDAKFASTAGPGTACRAMMSGPVRAGREAAGWIPRMGRSFSFGIVGCDFPR